MNVRIFWESVRGNACVHRLDLGLYSHPKEFLGNGVWTHVNSKGKIPSTGTCPQRRIEPATLWTASPSTTNWAIPVPTAGNARYHQGIAGNARHHHGTAGNARYHNTSQKSAAICTQCFLYGALLLIIGSFCKYCNMDTSSSLLSAV